VSGKIGATRDRVDQAIGARIRARRMALGLSQSDLARKIGVTFQQVQKYERGTNRVAGSRLVAVGDALGVTLGWMVGEESGGRDADEVFTYLSAPGALELLRAYAQLDSAETRNAVLTITRQLADVEA
jgi:transcriptional regulator with XRE-family HTH domain